MKKLPPHDWQERLKNLPAKLTIAQVASNFGCKPDDIYSMRMNSKAFDDALVPRLDRRARYLHRKPKLFGVAPPSLCGAKSSRSLFPQKINDEDLLLAMSRAELFFSEYLPAIKSEQDMSVSDRKFYAMLIRAAKEKIEQLQKDRRRLLGEVNQAKTRIHQLTRGGTPQVHASSGMPNQSQV